MIVFYPKVPIEFCHIGFRATHNRKRNASLAVGSACLAEVSHCVKLVSLALVYVWEMIIGHIDFVGFGAPPNGNRKWY